MKFQFHDIEVAGGAIVTLINLLKSSRIESRDKLERVLAPGMRIPWSQLCELLDSAVDEFGEQSLIRVAQESLNAPRFRRRVQLARQFLTLQDAFRFLLIPRLDPDFPNIRQMVETGVGQVDIYAYLTEGYQPSRHYFVAMDGAFHAVTTLFGVSGEHTSEVFATRAHYSFKFSEPRGVSARIRARVSQKLLSILSLPNVLRAKEILDRQTNDLQQQLVKRRQIEAYLVTSEKALDRRLTHISDVIFEFDEFQHLVYVSPNITRILGYGHEELENDPAILFPSKNYEQISRMLDQEDLNIGSYQLNLISKAGKRLWFELAISSFEVEGSPHLLLVARDISERRQTDAEMLKAQKLETLGVLSGSIAHDFNNLLVPILGHAELLVEEAAVGSLTAESAEQIQSAAVKAADLTKRLLSYAGDRVEAHTLFSLSDEITDLLKLIQTFVPAKVSFDHDIDLSVNVIGDAVQIRQVILNLVSNAAESMGGQVGNVRLSLKRQGERVRLTVEDTGCGMSAAEIDHVFVPFYTTKIAGRGLGLAAVQGIIKSHDGELVLRSQPGEGTTIEVWLQLTEEVPAQAVPTKDTNSVGSGRVLLLDDEPDVRLVAETILKKYGYDVVSFGHCDEAIEQFAKDSRRFDIVLLDVMMPKLNGFEVLALMRQIDPLIPALLITGFGPQFDKEKLLAADNTRILQKPYSIGVLTKTVKSLARVGS